MMRQNGSHIANPALILVTRPGETWVALNGGVPDDPGVEFRMPDSDIDFGDEPEGAA